MMTMETNDKNDIYDAERTGEETGTRGRSHRQKKSGENGAAGEVGNGGTREGQKKGKGFGGLIAKLTTAKSVLGILGRVILFLGVPYLYLIVCGLIDQSLLRTGYGFRDEFILFVFFSLMIFWIIGGICSIITIVRFTKNRKRR